MDHNEAVVEYREQFGLIKPLLETHVNSVAGLKEKLDATEVIIEKMLRINEPNYIEEFVSVMKNMIKEIKTLQIHLQEEINELKKFKNRLEILSVIETGLVVSEGITYQGK